MRLTPQSFRTTTISNLRLNSGIHTFVFDATAAGRTICISEQGSAASPRYHASSSSNNIDGRARKHHIASSTVMVHNYLGKITPYTQGWCLQEEYLQSRAKDIDGEINRMLLLQHSPTYTLGRGAKEEYLTFLDENVLGKKACERARSILARRGGKRLSLSNATDATSPDEHDDGEISVLAPNGAPIYRVERGGEVTYHGPGQIVCYPMLDLTQDPLRKDLHWYLRSIEEVVLRTLRHYNIDGLRDSINSGVFVDDNKICAVGLSASKWVTTHGFALNVYCDLSYFDSSIIMPCGLEERGVTSMSKELGSDISLDEVQQVLLQCFQDVFNLNLIIQSKE
uniref:lipoyl(octanoyl) transferase n=1 Tax=Leptocylindrus danicus TaxID=163516 RepID=A0A7S2K4N1_9STRA|mmetsp:Transcript_17662/g.26302  ORF Transcript_17662/g.26302 Transcript_17662/m.26302 type:complete len:339 (+) Transcript_17662:37-1053(+)